MPRKTKSLTREIRAIRKSIAPLTTGLGSPVASTSLGSEEVPLTETTHAKIALRTLKRQFEYLRDVPLWIEREEFPLDVGVDRLFEVEVGCEKTTKLDREIEKRRKICEKEHFFKGWEAKVVGGMTFRRDFSYDEEDQETFWEERTPRFNGAFRDDCILEISTPKSEEKIYGVTVSLMSLEDMMPVPASFLIYEPRNMVVVDDFRQECRDLLSAERKNREPNRTILVCNEELFLPLDTSMGWDRIQMTPEMKSVYDDFMFFINQTKWFVRNGIPLKRGYLFVGSPGNGKTLLARAMATTPGFQAFTFDFGSPRSSTNYHLQLAFQRASSQAPAVFLLEDVDRVFEKGVTNSQTVTKDALLSCLDGISGNRGVVVVGTANRPELIDEAILHRPGRFDRVVKIDNPKYKDRIELLRMVFKGSPDSKVSDEALERAAKATDGCSRAFLKELFIASAGECFQAGKRKVMDAHLDAALTLILSQHNLTDEQRTGFQA